MIVRETINQMAVEFKLLQVLLRPSIMNQSPDTITETTIFIKNNCNDVVYYPISITFLPLNPENDIVSVYIFTLLF